MFEKATKKKSYLWCAIYGPSGGGKTMSALRIATGMGGRIAFIDSERGSASKYSDRFAFDVCNLSDRTIEGYQKAIRAAGQAGYNVLIIDSLSHAWQELLTEVEKLAHAKYRGNTWSAWSEGTPKQRDFIDTILSFPGHVIATMRSDTAWESEKDDRSGKVRPVKVGLKPQQGKSIEYEFDLLLELSPEHIATVAKDRTGKFQDKIIDCPDEDFGRALAAWLTDGASADMPPPNRVIVPAVNVPPANGNGRIDRLEGDQRPSARKLVKLMAEHDINDVQKGRWQTHFNVNSLADLSDQQLEAICRKVESSVAAA